MNNNSEENGTEDVPQVDSDSEKKSADLEDDGQETATKAPTSLLNDRRGRREARGSSEREWRCIDDGTGSSVFYIKYDRTKTTKQPPGFVHEYLSDPQRSRKYYHKLRCIRCRQPNAPVLLSREDQTISFGPNYCEKCLVDTTLDVSQVKGCGTKIWSANADIMPIHHYRNLRLHFENQFRTEDILKRAQEARECVLTESKKRRDAVRGPHIGAMMEQEYGLYPNESKYISWGLQPTVFDEYYGHYDSMGRPHGRGVKTFADGSQYIGHWKDGNMESSEEALWTRPEGSNYEGNFVGGFKHGKGKQVYADTGSVYIGEWANGYEHGHGAVTYQDGSSFEGRFRFGRRDGPGVFTPANGGIPEKRVFKGGPSWHEPQLIAVVDPVDAVYNQPDTLKELALAATAHAMRHNRRFVSSLKITRRCPEHIKSLLARAYVNLCSKDYDGTGMLSAAGKYAFSGVSEEAQFNNFRINTAMIDSIVYFIEGNKKLRRLACIGAKLDFESISLICHHLPAFSSLRELDLSFNTLNLEACEVVLEKVLALQTMTCIRLAGCRLGPRAAGVVGAFLGAAQHVEEADFSFNMFEPLGADAIASGLFANKSLEKLKLRQNGFGPMGGRLFIEALRVHPTIRQLDLTDNRIGEENMKILSGRLQCSLGDLLESVRAQHTQMPTFYREGRFGETAMYVPDEDSDVEEE